jgi:hypothetical protein
LPHAPLSTKPLHGSTMISTFEHEASVGFQPGMGVDSTLTTTSTSSSIL